MKFTGIAKRLSFFAAAMLFVLMTFSTASAQIILGASPYTETLDGVGSGLPSGYTVRTGATATNLGTAVTFNTMQTAFSSTAGQFANYASSEGLTATSTPTQQNASTDRVIGLRQTMTFGDPGAAFVLQLANTTGRAGLSLSFKFQTLSVQGRDTTFTVDYGIGTTPTAFTPVTTVNSGNTFGSQTVTANFGNALNNQSGPVFIRIVALAPSTGSNSRDTVAIDDISISFTSALSISEFRLRGPNGANDEFVEIYNNTNSAITINTNDGSAGFSLAASDGVARFTIPNGTVIPGRGHYLGVNSGGYSLAAYPAGNGTTATGDATFTTDIPDNAGIALFNTANAANFTLANRLDAVGSTSEANTLYKEGSGYPALTPFSIDYSFYRDNCGKQGSIANFAACTTTTPIDTNNNAADFVFVDTNGTSAGAGQRLGAPGPENLSSPMNRTETIPASLIAPCVSPSAAPNRARDTTSDPNNNSTFGTLDIRRRFTNNTRASITRLRFRISDITTFPAPSGIADLRPRTSTALVVTNPCNGLPVTVQGTTLEEPSSQPNGGGFNSTLSAGTVTLATPVAAGATIDLRFLLGIQQTGSIKFFIVVEALP